MNGIYFRSREGKRRAIAGIVIFVAYVVTTILGLKLFTAPAIVFPAAGIALAALVIEGISFWPVIFIAALVSSLLTGSPLFSILIMPVAHTLQAVLGAFLLKKMRFDPVLRHLRDTLVLILACCLVSVVVPSLGMLTLWFNELYYNTSISSLTWGAWWIGILLSLLAITPLIVRWIAKPGFVRTMGEKVEICLSLSLLIIVNYFIFWSDVRVISGVSIVYFILVPFMWMALRTGPRFMTVGVFITAAMAISGTIFHITDNMSEVGFRILQVEIFVTILALIFYILVAMEEERSNAVRAYKSHISSLEGTLSRVSSQDKAKTEFIAVLAHELRNPLAPLMSSIELLREEGVDKGRTLLNMEGLVKTMRRLLDDLLDISRISKKKLIIRKEKIDLRDVVERSVNYAAAVIEERGQRLQVNLPTRPLMIYADPIRIEQAITNLLSNASKFTDEGGAISIFLSSYDHVAEIRVLDTGIGIDPEVISRIFEPFLQVELGERKNEGLGIGLALTYELVKMHGGTLRADSPGKSRGSEFIIELPVIDDTYKEEENVKPAKKVSEEFKPHTILVVDDNVAAADGIKMLLELKGHKADCAYSGDEALKKVSQTNFSVIVLDIGLPGMTGYEVATALRKKLKYKGTIIALSGYGQEEDKVLATEKGFDYYLVKPISIKDLEGVLDNLQI